MPDIDVSDLCDDPDIAGESFTVVRRQQVMQQNGVPSTATTNFSATGSITPTGNNSLVRQEAFSTQSNTVRVITTFRLRGPSKDSNGNVYEADIIMTADGTSYIVSSLNEWNKFGGGFMEAECTAIDFNPMAPT